MTARSDDTPSPPPGPFHANFGPAEGFIMRDTAPVMGVLAEPNGWPIGTAWHAGTLSSRRGPIQVWRLTVREGGRLKGPETEVEGRFVVKDRVFVRVEEVR